MKGILPLFNRNSGCDYHRTTLPLSYLGVDMDSFDGKTVGEELKTAKIVFWNRTPNVRLEYLIEERKKLGFKIVVDIDDYWVLHPKHNLYRAWAHWGTTQSIINALTAADAVTCTTEILADKVRILNKNVHIIPNGLPFGQEQFNEDRVRDQNMRFIYAGGGSHFWDIKTLTVPFTKVANNPQLKNANFTFAGFNDSTDHSRKEWLKFEQAFTVNGKIKNYTRLNTLPLDEYMNHYKYADVSLIPLEANNFNRFKSNLKIVEAGCKNIPCIAADVEPYSNEHNRDVILYAKNAAAWYDQIRYCTINPSFVAEKGLELGEYVRENYDLIKLNEYRKQLFEHLMN